MRAKSKNQKKTRDTSIIVTIGLPLLTFLVGGGGVWQYKQMEINQANHELDKTKYELEKAKYEVDKIPKITELRNAIDANIFKMVDLFKKHNDLNDELLKNYSEWNRNRTSEEIADIWTYKIPTIEDNIKQLESLLAKLENREPRKFDFPLAPPLKLKIGSP